MNITAIIPAYNEEKTIASVINAVKEVDTINRIIVVSDGSTDNTANIAVSLGVDVIELKKNVGKGGAIKTALDNCTSDVILFLDADLIGLNKNHVIDLLSPVVSNAADMSIGIFASGRFATDLAQKITPYLSGQRALKRSIINDIHNMDITRYGVEVALTIYLNKENACIKVVELKDLTHWMKEEKLGFFRGFAARLKMYWDILRCLRIEK